ncbi:MAG TPA: CusA/CzcA family heavy metal efflux RND transporter [Vicinamibacterales bacterium]|jgi:cobalt-zinc-cadmium resistance protein CzcA|nr:CusA/CzcA family heavy metal efflux RND transporter [Vicinamibacterales bacterium]
MIRRIISFAVHQPMFMAMLMALFIGAGVAAFRSLPVEAFPDVTDVQVTVITLFAGHAPEEVEKQITIPLEIQLSGLPNAVRMFSHTQFGLSYIILTFNDEANDYFARQQVLERLQGVDLPAGVQPQLAPLSTAIGEIYRYRLQGQGLDTTELRGLQDWVVSRRLKMIPGVADVVSFGGFIKQYEVTVNTTRMKSYNVTLQQVFSALGRGNANAGGSVLEQGEQQYLIRGIGMLRSGDDIGDIVVASHNGTPLLIKDIATVLTGAVPRQGLVGQDGDDEIVTGIVLMRKGENPSEVLKAVKGTVAAINENGLPHPARIVAFYDRTQLIGTTLSTVFRNLLEGAVLVAIVLFLFLGNVRAAAIVAVVIPLALLATFIGLRLRGIPANLLSLGAMDFGIIVDGAVIVLENIFRHLHQQREQHRDARAIVLDAATEVGRPTVFSIVIIILAHLPIFTLQRHEGRIFAPMAYTVVSALIGSLLFSLTLVPLLCLHLLSKSTVTEENALVRACKRLYRPVLATALAHRVPVLVGAVAALAGSLALAPRLGTEFLPELNEGSIWINLMLPPGISVTEASRQLARVRAVIRTIPEVRTVVSKTGRPEDGTDPKMINMAEFLVDLKPPAEWRPHTSKDALIDQMNTALQALPGIEPSFSQPIRDNVLESISQIDGQIVIKVFGEDMNVLRHSAADVLRAIAPVRGVARAFVDRGGQVPQLQIEIDRARAARYGLNVADVEDVIETALGGRTATELWEGERRFAVVVRLGEEERRNPEAIRNVLVDTPAGVRVPLSDVASVSVGSGAMNIARESGTRVMAIGVFIQGRDMGGVVTDMQQRVKASVRFPTGYYASWGGEFENQQRAMSRLSLIVPISILLIFVILFNAFGSIKDASLILLNVPFALIGGILALYLTGIHLSVSAAIGFIALFGQAVLNGVVMVSYFNQLRRAGASAHDAALEGSMVRLRTVLMTTMLAMLGLMPMALSHSIGSEVQRPLAVVIIGGLFSAAALTLIVLPALFVIFHERRHHARTVT